MSICLSGVIIANYGVCSEAMAFYFCKEDNKVWLGKAKFSFAALITR
jgi:hypothetical protein